MRYLILLIVIIGSCNIKHDKSVMAQTNFQDSLVNVLVQNDFLLYSDTSETDSLKQSFLRDGYIFSAGINRYVHIDAEELAEGSFDFFRNDLTKILKRRALEITFSATRNFEKTHEVLINNRIISLFDDKSLADYSFWDIGSRKFFKAINEQLEISKSKERFYLLYEGNDLGAILLTEKQFEIIRKMNEGNSKEIPYQP